MSRRHARVPDQLGAIPTANYPDSSLFGESKLARTLQNHRFFTGLLNSYKIISLLSKERVADEPDNAKRVRHASDEERSDANAAPHAAASGGNSAATPSSSAARAHPSGHREHSASSTSRRIYVSERAHDAAQAHNAPVPQSRSVCNISVYYYLLLLIRAMSKCLASPSTIYILIMKLWTRNNED